MADEVFPNPVAASSAEERQVLHTVIQSFKEADKFRRPIKKKWDNHFRLLNGVGSKNTQAKAWQTDRFVNIVSVASTLLKSRFYQGLPIGAATARTLAASLNEDGMNQVLQYDQERGHLENELGKVIDDGINYGCGILRLDWKTETAANIPHTPDFMAKMVSTIRRFIPGFKESEILYDGATFSWVDPFSFYWDPAGTTIKECAYVIERTEESLYQMRKDPAFDPKVLKRIASLEQNAEHLESDLRERMLALGVTETDAKRVYGKVKEGLHEVWRYKGAYDIDGDGIEEECRIYIVDRMIVGCLEENPYWHSLKNYVKWDFHNIPGFFVGRSLMDQAAAMQEEYNDIVNQLGDIRKLTLKPVIKFRLGSDVEPETLMVAPGMLWGLESMDDVDFYQPPVEAVDRLLELLKYEREMFQLLTGMNDVSLGQQDVGIGDNTATGATIAQEQTELRYKGAAIGLDLMMEELGEMLISNEQQFRSRKDIIPVKDPTGSITYKTIAPKDISGLFSYRIISSSLSLQSPSMKVNNLLKALQVTEGDPNYNATAIKDQILQQLDIDPKSIKVTQGSSDMGSVQKFAALPQEQQQEALAKMPPADREIMQKALTSLNASQDSNQQPPAQNGAPAIQGGTPPGPALPVAQPPSMAVPVGPPR